MNISACIFDMDGLLLDTEPIIMTAIAEAGKELGWEIEDHVQVSTIGRPDHDSKKIFMDYYGNDFPYDEINRRRFDYVENIVKTSGAPLKSGAKDILIEAKNSGLILGLATSTPGVRARFLLEEARLLDFFHSVVFGDQVINGKPEPDIFLLSAEKMRVPPEECIVFEDSRSGIIAASEANMWPILVPDVMKPSKDVIKRTYRQYPDLLVAKDDLKHLIKSIENS